MSEFSFPRLLLFKCSLCLRVIATYLVGDETTCCILNLCFVSLESNSLSKQTNSQVKDSFSKRNGVFVFVPYLYSWEDLARVDGSTFLLVLQYPFHTSFLVLRMSPCCLAFLFSFLQMRTVVRRWYSKADLMNVGRAVYHYSNYFISALERRLHLKSTILACRSIDS